MAMERDAVPLLRLDSALSIRAASFEGVAASRTPRLLLLCARDGQLGQL
jgi:hypothetical protein